MRVRKLSNEWRPSENPNLEIGQIIDISNPTSLVEQGLAIYVDENDVDYEKVPVAWEYRPKQKEAVVQEEEKKPKELTPQEKREYIKTLRTAQLEKARAAKRKKELEKELEIQKQKTEAAKKEAIEALTENPL